MEFIQDRFLIEPTKAFDQIWDLLEHNKILSKDVWRWYLPGLSDKTRIIELLEQLVSENKISFGELLEWFHDTEAALYAIDIFLKHVTTEFEIIDNCYEHILESDEVMNSNIEVSDSKTETLRTVLDSHLEIKKTIQNTYDFNNTAYEYLPKEGCAMDLEDDQNGMPRTSFIVARKLQLLGLIPDAPIHELMNNYRTYCLSFFEKLRN